MMLLEEKYCHQKTDVINNTIAVLELKGNYLINILSQEKRITKISVISAFPGHYP